MPGVNRYDRAPQRLYISLYVPIPFDELYKIGTANNEATEKALENLTTNMNKWAEFYSPSLVDMKNWYDLTVGEGSKIASELASNPDLIKTPEGRSRILSFINNRPYYLLSLLKQGAEALNERKKSEADLIKANRYNPTYHAFDYTNYNTLDNGVLNLTSLLPWYTMPEIVAPYVNLLKDQYLGTQGGYDYTGVNSLMVLDQINKYRSDILNHPSIQMQIDDLVKNYDLTREDAENAVMQDAVTAALQYVRYNRTPNQYSLVDWTARANGKGPNNPQNNSRTDFGVLDDTVSAKYNTMEAEYRNQNNFTTGVVGLPYLINYQLLKNNISVLKRDLNNYINAFKDVGLTFSQTNSADFVYSLIGGRPLKNSASFGTNYAINPSSLVPFASFANQMKEAVLNQKNKTECVNSSTINSVLLALNKISAAYITGSPTVVRNGEGGYLISFDILIPTDTANNAGLTLDDVEAVGGNISYGGANDEVSSTVSSTQSLSVNSENKSTATKTDRNNTNIKEKGTLYYKIPVITTYDNTAFGALGANANSWKGSSGTHSERNPNVSESYATMWSNVTNLE